MKKLLSLISSFAAILLMPGQALALGSQAEEFIKIMEKTASVRCELKKLTVKIREAEKKSNRDEVSKYINEVKKLTDSFNPDALRMMQILDDLRSSPDFPAVVERQKIVDANCN
ncbi:MAG: hypothetical protein OEV92_10040 [Nitrospinota bacterium]|nr:hypothetical protein [Nitrospinota bacterium]